MKYKIFAKIIYLFLKILNSTWRYHFIDATNKEKAKKLSAHGSYVFATWHQNLAAGIMAHSQRDDQFTMIISSSKDGDLVAFTCENFGHAPARGSSTRGGREALIEMVKKLKLGIPGALTVDGPKGPKFKVKFGIIEICKMAECPIVPYIALPSRYYTFQKSWDQFRFPLPFTRIYVVIGDPIMVPNNLTPEKFPEFSEIIAHKIHETEQRALSVINANRRK